MDLIGQFKILKYKGLFEKIIRDRIMFKKNKVIEISNHSDATIKLIPKYFVNITPIPKMKIYYQNEKILIEILETIPNQFFTLLFISDQETFQYSYNKGLKVQLNNETNFHIGLFSQFPNEFILSFTFSGMKVANKSTISTLYKKGFQLKKILGEGAQGTVFSGCDLLENSCEYAIKVMNKKNPLANKNEYFISQEMSDANIAPKLFAYHQGKNKDLIIMQKYDISIQEYILIYGSLPENMIMRLKEKIDQMHQHGVIHRDLLPKNVVIKMGDNNQPTDVFIIDWNVSFSRKVDQEPVIFKKLERVIQYHQEEYDHLQSFVLKKMAFIISSEKIQTFSDLDFVIVDFLYFMNEQ